MEQEEKRKTMKKILKRTIAIVCAMALILGGGIYGVIRMVKAEQASDVKEWPICQYASGLSLEKNGAGGFEIAKSDSNINIPEGLTKENLSLYLKLDIQDAVALASMKEAFVELAQETCDVSEINWSLSGQDLKVGLNEIELKLSEATNYPGTGASFDIGKTIQYFRMYSVVDAGTSQVILYDVKLINSTEAGLVFGETDTYLQLENKLSKTPRSIEASVKKGALVKEWMVRPSSTTTFSYGLTPTMGTVTSSQTEPAIGTTFAQVNVAAYSASINESGMFGFAQNFDAIDLSAYTKDQLAVAFWFYSSTGDTLPLGQIELTSGGGPDVEEIAWHPEVAISVNKGWNYVELNLNQITSNVGNIDLSSVNYFRWYTDGSSKITKNSTFAITDVEIIVKDNPNVKWTIRSANNAGFWYGLQPIVSTWQSPDADTPYAEVTVPAYDAGVWGSGKFGFTHSFDEIDASAYNKDELVLSFWLYSSVDGKLPHGNMELTSSSQPDQEELAWDINYNQKLHIGWNYIEAKLSGYNTTTGDFDLSSINFLRLYTDDAVSSALTTETTYRITDIRLSVMDGKTGAGTYKVSLTENVDTKTITNKEMIFSNTNVESETAPYALFISKSGYPSLLIGTNLYTLNYDVCTGEWVDIAVVCDETRYINFYINGEWIAKSESALAQVPWAPSSAHCIGADGKGGQIFKGSIADVRVWEDVRTADEIKDGLVAKKGNTTNGLDAQTQGLLGSWFLVGDIQYVLETMPDTSKNSNTAVFRGTRASDWIDYDKTKYSFLYDSDGNENYWSIVFIPDIQNLTTGAYTDKWYAVADWIANNVDAENIQHVIGAGDSTWNNLDWQYDYAKTGFDKFTDKVSWSNMTGNHDYIWGTTVRDSDMYQSYFGEDYIQGTEAGSTYVGSYNDPNGVSGTENSYYRFSVNGVKWMILQLEYHPRMGVMDWAKSVLEQYPEDNVIVTTHGYLDGYGNYSKEYMDFVNANPEGDSSEYLGQSASPIWNTYLKDYSNVKLILCGHSGNGTGSIATRTETNSNGDEVEALMINGQDMDMGDNATPGYYTNRAVGLLGILRFSADGTKAAVQYYAPDDDKSFSPIDPNGKRDSNNITLEFNVETCSHKNTTVSVNVNNADEGKEGYTGDTYCADCDTIFEKGQVISAMPVKEKAPENTKTETPSTGDYSQVALWGTLAMVAAGVVVCVMKRNGKEE